MKMKKFWPRGDGGGRIPSVPSWIATGMISRCEPSTPPWFVTLTFLACVNFYVNYSVTEVNVAVRIPLVYSTFFRRYVPVQTPASSLETKQPFVLFKISSWTGFIFQYVYHSFCVHNQCQIFTHVENNPLPTTRLDYRFWNQEIESDLWMVFKTLVTLRTQAVRHSASDVTLAITSPSADVTAKFSTLVVRQSTDRDRI